MPLSLPHSLSLSLSLFGCLPSSGLSCRWQLISFLLLLLLLLLLPYVFLFCFFFSFFYPCCASALFGFERNSQASFERDLHVQNRLNNWCECFVLALCFVLASAESNKYLQKRSTGNHWANKMADKTWRCVCRARPGCLLLFFLLPPPTGNSGTLSLSASVCHSFDS